ncbi:MAG: lysophospholipid acyltransferase family protein, partial [Burkholderiales bacterium]
MDRPIDAPPLHWFLLGADRRRIAWQYWVHDLLWGSCYTSVHFVLRLLPADAVSAAGSWFGNFCRRHVNFKIGSMRRYRAHEALARKNWAWLRAQDNDPAVVEGAMNSAFRNVGRVQCEFAALKKIWHEGRVSVEGAQHLDAARDGSRPIIVVGLHIGNWELIGPSLLDAGHICTAVYQEPPSRFDHYMVVSSRLRWGAKLIPPGRGGGRIALRVLVDRKDVLVIFLDECVDGVVYAPFFGRPARYDGNIAYAARLAAITNAVIIPAYCRRLRDASFRVTFLPPIELVHTGDRKRDLIANVAAINANIEPIVRANLDQWFWIFDLQQD